MADVWNLLFPFSVFSAPWLAPAALILDLALGDPALPWPHPVCLIGRFQSLLEGPCRRFQAASALRRSLRGRVAGGLALGISLSLTATATWICLHVPLVAPLLALYLAWSGLAMGCLLSTGKQVLARVEHDNLSLAREGVGWLVSRDISRLNRQQLRKTLADTLSENFTDAFMAPFFWLALTGPVGLWLYKTVSTMDSQWGYLTPRWRDIGFCGARADDMLAWLPARLSVLTLFFTDLLPLKRSWLGAWPGLRAIKSQAHHMPSPNSGWSMGACAWLCGCRMGGTSIYFGTPVFKPWLGPPKPLAHAWNQERLLHLCVLMRRAAVVGGFGLWGICCAMLFLSGCAA